MSIQRGKKVATITEKSRSECCVTTGWDWQFLKLEDKLVTIDEDMYYLVEMPNILGIFQAIIDAF